MDYEEREFQRQFDLLQEELAGLEKALSERDRTIAELKSIRRDVERGDWWCWQGDEEDHPESLTCPVVMSADILREHLKEMAELRSQNDRLRQDRYDALSVTSKDGLLASEWVARAGKAERQVAELRAVVERLPKDATGKPVAPGQELWALGCHGVVGGYADVLEQAVFPGRHSRAFERIAECYPTRTEAIAALKAEETKP